MRLVSTLPTNDSTVVVVIHRDSEWNEWVASVSTHGKRSEDSAYRDSDRQSTYSTARCMVDAINARTAPVLL